MPKPPRHAVVMDHGHYAGLLRPVRSSLAGPPQWDPLYHPLGEVMIRDLADYAAIAEGGGAS